MQLRSGKTTQIVSINGIDATHNARFYGKIHNGNITITLEPSTPPGTPRGAPNAPGKKTKPIIAKHSMTLRPRKLQPEFEKEHAPQHFADMISMRIVEKPKPFSFRTWLVSRLKGFITGFDNITGGEYKMRVLEKCRLFAEMLDVLNDHIDYILTEPDFKKFAHVLHAKLLSFKSDLTALLNGESLPGGCQERCNFTQKERNFVGTVRADIVKLAVIMRPRLPILPISLFV
jgi:hypothetical protein